MILLPFFSRIFWCCNSLKMLTMVQWMVLFSSMLSLLKSLVIWTHLDTFGPIWSNLDQFDHIWTYFDLF